MSKGLLSPRARVSTLADFGERSAFVSGQQVGRVRLRRRPRAWPSIGRLLRRIAILAFVAAIPAGLVTGGWWLVTSPRFKVSTVEVRGTQHVTVERILEAAKIEPGKSLFLIDPRAAVQRIEALPQVERAEIVRALPNRVTVRVEERKPFTLLHSGTLSWIDENGRVLAPAGEAVVPPAPVVSGIGEGDTAKARDAVRLIRALLRSGSTLATEISEIDMSESDGPILYTAAGVEVRLGNDDWDERLTRLEAVLAQKAAREGNVRTVDLRFRDQVVLQGGR
jgi:cell division protein FtsQ